MIFMKKDYRYIEELGYEIPVEWGVSKLGDKSVAKIILGQSPESSTYNNIGKGLPFLQGKSEFGPIYPSPTIYCSQSVKTADSEDVLLSVRAPVGEVNIANSKCCIGRGISSIKAMPNKLNYLFLFYYFKLNGKKLDALAGGSTFKAIRRRDIENYQIPIPPIEEQQKIATILSTTDQTIENSNKLIEKSNLLKRSLMKQLLTKGIGHKKYKYSTGLGFEIPDEWKVASIKDVGKIVTGKTPSTKVDSFWNGNIPFVTPSDITWIKKQKNYERTVSEDGLKQSTEIPAGALMVTCIASIGKNAISEQRCCTNQQINSIIPNADFYVDYLYYYIEKIKPKLESLASKMTIQILNKTNFEKILIAKPPLQEQQKIAEILSKVDTSIILETERNEKLNQLKLGLMNDLLTGKYRVLGDLNDSNSIQRTKFS
jgi:type I restriction enzyme S subunit